MINQVKPTNCEACGAVPTPKATPEHLPNCLLDILGECACGFTTQDILEYKEGHFYSGQLNELLFHGRKMYLCDECHSKDVSLLKTQANQNQRIVTDSVETQVVAEVKKLHQNFERWQEIYVTERPNWIISNFESPEEMKEQLVAFIVSMEKLEWEIKAKRRAAFDSAKELDARLSKEDRDRLINDPSFKPPTNSEFKKIVKERETDQAMKSLDIPGATKQQRKAAEGLLKMGMSIEDIKATLKLKD